MKNILELGAIIWSVLSFLAISVFFLGGQWTYWSEIRDAHQNGKVINQDVTIGGSDSTRASDGNKDVLKLDGPGIDVELNLADKTFYASDSCVVGEVKATSMINDGNAQAAVCVCLTVNHGNEGRTGRGWYCLN